MTTPSLVLNNVIKNKKKRKLPKIVVYLSCGIYTLLGSVVQLYNHFVIQSVYTCIFPRKTHAIMSSDEKNNILFHLTWSNRLELIFHLSLVTENPLILALSNTDLPRRPAVSYTVFHAESVR